MKKTILGILCFFIIIGVICCIPIYHNVQLNKFANQLDDIAKRADNIIKVTNMGIVRK